MSRNSSFAGGYSLGDEIPSLAPRPQHVPDQGILDYLRRISQGGGENLESILSYLQQFAQNPADEGLNLLGGAYQIAQRPDLAFDSGKQYVEDSFQTPEGVGRLATDVIDPTMFGKLSGLALAGHLNIGMKAGDKMLTKAQIDRALKKYNAEPRHWQIRNSNTEPTYIADSPDLAPEQVHELAVKLNQEAIAQRTSDGSGMLLGPKAAEWGAYNPDLYLDIAPKFPQYADQYPPVAEPVMRFDKEKGTYYKGKGDSPEFMDERTRIKEDMEREGYSPFFPVADRYYANADNYPTDVNTLTQGLPKKQKTIDMHRGNVQTDAARERLQAAFDEGNRIGGNDRWYAMGQLEDEFIKELGPVEGPKMFKERFAEAMAATTSKAQPEANFLMAAYGNYMRQKGLRVPEAGYELPPAVGNKNAGTNMAMYNSQINDGAGLGIDNPKRHNFAGNMMGRLDNSTIDAQMTGLMTPGKAAPPGDSYFAYEELLAEMAQKNNVAHPAEFQDVAWGGKKALDTKGGYQGQPMISIVNESIERTHQLTGLPREEILRQFIRGTGPMYGLAGASLLAPMLMRDNETM